MHLSSPATPPFWSFVLFQLQVCDYPFFVSFLRIRAFPLSQIWWWCSILRLLWVFPKNLNCYNFNFDFIILCFWCPIFHFGDATLYIFPVSTFSLLFHTFSRPFLALKLFRWHVIIDSVFFLHNSLELSLFIWGFGVI